MALKTRTYKTISGDTWDKIAYKYYNNELLCDKIMDANRHLLDYMVFPDNIVINIPSQEDIRDKEVASDFPDWRAKLVQ
jgi:phage tail protein X